MIKDIDRVALELANKALNNHFDPEAYLVKYVAEIRLKQEEDLVPDSNVDEFIQRLLNLFIIYSNDKTKENLDALMLTLKQVISELYHTSETKLFRDIIKDTIKSLQQIYS